MHISASALLSSIAFTAVAAQSACPSVWNNISTELTSKFTSAEGCTALARAAIRASFHDCFPGTGGCDGSLLLAGELQYTANQKLLDIGNTLIATARTYNVGYADIIQFAAAHAVKSCTGGPLIKVLIGRTDSSTPAPAAELPPHNASADGLLTAFAARGLTAIDLAALIGAHTAAAQFSVDTSRPGTPLDTTPGSWDVTYYKETLDGTAPFRLESDISISKNTQTAPSFQTFAGDTAAWQAAFVPAMEKMAVLGVTATNLIDCTSALPQ